MADVKNQGRGAAENAAERGRNVNANSGGVMAGAVDSVRQSAETAYNAAAGLASEAKDKIQDLSSDAGNLARHASDRVQEWAGEAYQCTSETMKNFGTDVTDMVKRYPIQSIMVGFGIGLLIGRTVRSA